jgi:hypothetical protein
MSKIVCFLMPMLLAAPAWAQATKAHPKAAIPDGARAQVHYDFDDDLVEGGVLQPDGSLIDSRRPIKRSSLIQIRESFVPELLKSAEDR